MRKLYFAIVAYTVLGMASGLFYRELTRANEFTGSTQLAVVHTHLLTLGTILLLIVLVLEKVFVLSRSRWFSPFFWTYNAGLALTAGMLTVNGTMTVLGHETGPMQAGISGMGHILLTVALAFLLGALHHGVRAAERSTGPATTTTTLG